MDGQPGSSLIQARKGQGSNLFLDSPPARGAGMNDCVSRMCVMIISVGDLMGIGWGIGWGLVVYG